MTVYILSVIYTVKAGKSAPFAAVSLSFVSKYDKECFALVLPNQRQDHNMSIIPMAGEIQLVLI